MPVEKDPSNLHFEFLYNGTMRGSQEGHNAFADTEEGTTYSFGVYGSGSADTYYTVTSFDIVAVE